jgi:hypothetical protein
MFGNTILKNYSNIKTVICLMAGCISSTRHTIPQGRQVAIFPERFLSKSVYIALLFLDYIGVFVNAHSRFSQSLKEKAYTSSYKS